MRRPSWPWLAGAAVLAALVVVAAWWAASPSMPSTAASRGIAGLPVAPPLLAPDPAHSSDEAAPARVADTTPAAPDAAFECGSGPCDQPAPAETEPEPEVGDTAPAAATRPLPADMDAWALDPQVDPAWRGRDRARLETLGNVPPTPDEYDATPADG